MELFGFGGLELVFVLVVMLLVLGPARMVDFARQAGKWWREAQRTLRGIADAATVKMDEEAPKRQPPRDPMPGPEDAVARDGTSETSNGAHPNADRETRPADDESTRS